MLHERRISLDFFAGVPTYPEDLEPQGVALIETYKIQEDCYGNLTWNTLRPA